MLKKNDPAREGRAVECLLAGDIHGHSIRAARVQTLRARLPLSAMRADLIATLAWGALADDN